MFTALTRNLGYRVTAMEWLAHEAEAGTLPDVLLLQEVLPNRLRRLEATHDLRLAPASAGLPSARTSVLGFRRNLGFVVTDKHEVFAALGTYAACADVELENGSVIFAKRAHQSKSCGSGRLNRHVGKAAEVRTCSVVEDVLLTEATSHSGAPLLIAGDLNEARAWDATHPGHTCSADFFEGIKESGLTDVTFRDWRSTERPTRRDPDY
jgi:hypothetical protein